MIATYASSLKPTITSFTVSAIAGSAASIQRNFRIAYRNRAGTTVLSDVQNVTSTGVDVVLNPFLATEEVFWIVITVEETGNDTDAGIIYQWQARDPDQLTKRSLPTTISFTTDDHFVVNRAVATSADLAALIPPAILPGAICYVADIAAFYRFDPEVTTGNGYDLSYGAIAEVVGNWVKFEGTFNAYILDNLGIGGADQPTFNVEHSLKIPPKIGAANGTPERYFLNNGFANDGGSPVVDGRFTFEVAIDGLPGYEALFANKLRYTLIGYLDKSDYTLDTSMAGVGNPILWTPTQPIILPVDLPRNHAAVLDIEMVFDNADMLGTLPTIHPELQISIVEAPLASGQVSSFATFLGDSVYSDGGKLLIVPGLKRLDGRGSVQVGYEINDPNTQMIVGLTDDTPGQQAAMSGSLNGLVNIKQSGQALDYSEVLRALISTEPGISKPIAAATLTLANEGFTVTIENPINALNNGIIRADYPDILLAGNDQGFFTPVNAYVEITLDGVAQKSQIQTVSTIATQTFTFADLNNFTSISAFSTQPDPEFSLFEPVSVVSASTAGTLTGVLEVQVYYEYLSPNYKATKISHDNLLNPAVVPTLSATLAATLALLSQFTAHITNTNNPHQVTAAQIGAALQSDFQIVETQVNVNTPAIANNVTNIQTNISDIALNTTARIGLGTAANKDWGTNTGELIELVNVAGAPGLPAVDGSQLTGINALSEIEFVDSAFTSEAVLPPKHYLIDTTTAIASTTLPSNSDDKSRISFSDRTNSFPTNNATITAGSGDTIDGQASLALDTEGQALTLVYDLTNTNWVVVNGVQSASTGGGDMLTSTYDTDNNGIVDIATDIDGMPAAGNLKFYATDGTGQVGLYDINLLVKEALELLIDPDKLKGSVIENFRDIDNVPTDGFAPIYDLASDTILWQFVDRGIGAGAILIPSSQSLFETADGALSGYAPDMGTATFTDILILTTAAAPDNQIVSEQLVINTTNTGAVLDLGVSDTVLRIDWAFNTGDNLGLICRYDSDGNMIIVDFSASAIAVKSVVADTITTIDTTGFTFANGTIYKLKVQAIGVQYKVLVDDVEIIPESLSNDFLTATKFGIGRLN